MNGIALRVLSAFGNRIWEDVDVPKAGYEPYRHHDQHHPHRQRAGEHFTLDGEFNYWSESEILRDFRPRAFFPVQAPDTFVEANYTGQNYFLSLFARFQPNSFQRVQERLPELRFDLLPLTVGNGFVERFSASAARQVM